MSDGCTKCYAERQAHRFSGKGQPYEGLVTLRSGRPGWTGVVNLIADKLADPLRWRKPARVFVNSMSDLFHEALSNEEIAAVFGVMAACPQHTFQVLTKRAERMRKWFEWAEKRGQQGASMFPDDPNGWRVRQMLSVGARRAGADVPSNHEETWPLPNVWLGVSVEDQERAGERIHWLLGTPATIRWVSAEPLLGPLNLTRVEWGNVDFCDALRPGSYRGGLGGNALDWVVVGGESGPGARPCALEWLEALRDQCVRAGVPYFCKQLGGYVVSELRTGAAECFEDPTEHGLSPFRAPNGEYWAWRAGLADKKGGDPSEWPELLRVRQWPEVGR